MKSNLEFQEEKKAFARLLNIMEDLRLECPWDRKQTIHTLRPLTIEETYELVDAILEENWNDIQEELGDVMLHLVFYAKIAKEEGRFDVSQMINKVCDKLIERHPHIYGDVVVESEEDVKRNWERIKMKTGKKRLLQGVPKSLPAMIKALRLQEKTAQVGFEWKDKSDVWKKVVEEMSELQEAVDKDQQNEKEEELGDVFFALINYARFIGVDPEAALARTNRKFQSRFEYVEDQAPKPLNDMHLDEMDVLWEESKKALKI